MAYTTIDDPSAYFKCQLYTGTGSSNAVTFNDTDTDMQPDLVITKNRDSARAGMLFDSVRGVEKRFVTSTDDASGDDSNTLTAFGSDGFTVGSSNEVNESSDGMVAWCWKESATSGFDMVAYTGTGSAKTESHSLSAVPHFMLVKQRSNAYEWKVYHHKNTSAPETDYLILNTTAATFDRDTVWNDTAPTSSVFSVGTEDGTNENTETFMAYLFSEKQGYSKFGSYTGNGNADGAFVYTGFKPAFILLKNSSGSSDWQLIDNKRLGYNVDNNRLKANETQTEDTTDYLDLLSNGFKIRSTSGDYNTSGNTFIYAAFAEAPLVNSNGVPCNAR